MAGLDALVPSVTLPVGWELTDNYFRLNENVYGELDNANARLAPSRFTSTTETKVITANVRRGRSLMTQNMSAGTATVTIEKTSSITTAAFALGEFAQVNGVDSGGTTPVFSGVLTGAQEVSDPSSGATLILLTIVDRLRTAADIEFQADTDEGAGVTVGDRITAALSPLASLDDYAAAIDASTISIDGDSWGGSILSNCNNAALSDGGVFYYAKDGTFTFLEGDEVYDASNYVTPVVTMTDGTGSYPIRASDPNRTLDNVINWVTMRSGTLEAIGENGESVTAYGRRMRTINTLNTSASEMATVAQRYADAWSAQDDQYRDVVAHAARGDWAPKLPDLELYDFVAINFPVSVEAVIEGIGHTYTEAAGWQTTMVLNTAVPATAS